MIERKLGEILIGSGAAKKSDVHPALGNLSLGMRTLWTRTLWTRAGVLGLPCKIGDGLLHP
jgi:hypothetical protein